MPSVAKVAKTFGSFEWPKLLASFATPKYFSDRALLVSVVTDTEFELPLLASRGIHAPQLEDAQFCDL